MNRKYLAYIMTFLALMVFIGPGELCAQKIPKINPAKAGQKVGRKLMTRGQRWIKRSVRELRKKKNIPLEEKEIRSQFKIIGSEPSWLVYNRSFEHDYYFNLLTDLVIGEYDINPETGGYRNKKSFKSMINRRAILDSAYSQNENASLLVRLIYSGDFGPPERRQSLLEDFLLSSAVQKDLADSLTKSLIMDDGTDLGSAIGVIVDFKEIPPTESDAFLDFFRILRGRLAGPIYINLPGLDPSNSIFTAEYIQRFDNLTDGYLLRGYGYERKDTLSSSSAIEQAGPNDIRRSVDYYIDQAQISPEKLFVEFSYFGAVYSKKGSGFQPRSHRPLLPFDQIKSPKTKVKPLGKSMSKWAEGKDGTIYTFDDYESLEQKYNWVKEKGLGGIGILGLGYYSIKDGEKPWEAIGNAFSADPPQTVYPAMAFLLMFLGFGIFVSVIQYWQVRNEIARKRRHQWFYGISITLIGIVILCCMIPLIPPEATAGTGTLMIMFPFLRRFRTMFKKWGLV